MGEVRIIFQSEEVFINREQPRQIVIALPVGPYDTIQELSEEVNEVICLRTPPCFYVIGQFFAYFEQVDDNKVLEILKLQAERKTGRDKGEQYKRQIKS